MATSPGAHAQRAPVGADEPAMPDGDDLRARVAKNLEEFLQQQVPVLDAISDELSPLLEAMTDLLAGGKRLRPAFCYWGWRGAGRPDTPEIVRAASALELLQACALVHDDVMDGSDTRRGKPAAHRRFASLHRQHGYLGSADGFGVGAAILLGDLCLSWTDQLLHDSGVGPEAYRRVKPVLDAMRTELMAGQYLDLLEQVQGRGSVEGAMRVVRFKSAKYTVERPLHVGAALAGAGPELTAAYTAYGLPLGEAFQLRDDVLGVFGDPAETGKPAGDDLREGKRTVLVALALEEASPAQAALVRRHLGDPHLEAEGVTALREVLHETGARARVEQLIEGLTARALDAVEVPCIDPDAGDALRQLALVATTRRG